MMLSVTKFIGKQVYCFLIISLLFISTSFAQRAVSKWAYLNAQGRLAYKTLPTGDRIMDFSQAGYMGGGIVLPTPNVTGTLKPLQGDNTDAIQQAIDEVSKKELIKGVRGVVLLAPGIFNCDRPITISATGVVLRGSGPDSITGSVINMTGSPHTCIIIKGNIAIQKQGNVTNFTENYVPAATDHFTINDASGFAVGDTILITRPVTQEWVKFMEMDQLVRDGKKQTWLTGDITIQRVITKLDKNTITVDVPLSDNYDAKYLGAAGVKVQKISVTGEPAQIGVENLRIVSPAQSLTINDKHNQAINMRDVTDSWLKNIQILNTVNSISIAAKRITVKTVNIFHEVPTLGAAKPADLSAGGSQILFEDCRITGDNVFFLATGAKVSGPIVLLNCVFKGNGWIQPHQRWATGLLIDNCIVPDGGIELMNRGEMGSGHGWAIGWSVAWNCTAKSFLNQQPPGSANWMIGCKGDREQKPMPFTKDPLLPEGIYDAHGTSVVPESLYLAQLKERLEKTK
ncbi:hypothetical protein ACI6Q2_11975 [Chitinophagaceae bacterium LWZ2-11]